MPPKRGRGRGRGGRRGRGRPRNNHPASASEESAENEGQHDMPHLHDSAKENSDENSNEDTLEASIKEISAQGTEEVSGTKRKRRSDSVADVSSLEPRTSRFRERSIAQPVQEEPQVDTHPSP